MAISGKARFLREFPAALHDGYGAIFVGAGVSMAAGYPSWTALLHEIGEELGVSSSDVHDLAALAQWHIRESGGATGVRNVIKREIGRDLSVPETLKIIARLPVRHIWTTNYDRLVERAFAEIRRPIDPVSGAKDLALKPTPGASRFYKMHGSIDRLDDIVISTDDYELYRSRRGAFLPLLQAHLNSMSMLFVGLSLTDPNIRHVLSLIRESFTEAPPEHFAILRPPQREDFKSEEEFKARKTQHSLWAKDLSRYGLVAVDIGDYDEVPSLLADIEKRVASRRVWVSGSWPMEAATPEASRLYALAEQVGRLVGESGRDLVSGAGLLVGSAAIGGFIDTLRSQGGGWDLDRRLIARPFPQPIPGQVADQSQWKQLRRELARLAGIAIFLGGTKLENGQEVAAAGVLEEFEAAKTAGAFLLPVGATGGASKIIAEQLTKAPATANVPSNQRPTREELAELSDPATPHDKILNIIANILRRLDRS